MAKFSFYFGYWDLLGKLSSRQFKKIVRALSEYAEIGKIPDNLPKLSFMIFMDIKRVIDAEKEQEELKEKKIKAGKKGAKKRWNS